jgi:hypothetical protein
MVRGPMSDEGGRIWSRFWFGSLGIARFPDAIFSFMRAGAPWRGLPMAFVELEFLRRQLRRLAISGVWDVILAALSGSQASETTLQMNDAAIVRAHHCAGG